MIIDVFKSAFTYKLHFWGNIEEPAKKCFKVHIFAEASLYWRQFTSIIIIQETLSWRLHKWTSYMDYKHEFESKWKLIC